MIIPDDVRIYVVTGVTDLRKGIDGYASIVQDQLHLNPFDQALYIFCNKDYNKIKILYWDSTGFWLLYHRLEKGHFKWKKDETTGSIQISKQQFEWLRQGLKIEQKTSIHEIQRKYV